jgi:DNA-binding CsgD family transcriptional regulator
VIYFNAIEAEKLALLARGGGPSAILVGDALDEVARLVPCGLVVASSSGTRATTVLAARPDETAAATFLELNPLLAPAAARPGRAVSFSDGGAARPSAFVRHLRAQALRHVAGCAARIAGDLTLSLWVARGPDLPAPSVKERAILEIATEVLAVLALDSRTTPGSPGEDALDGLGLATREREVALLAARGRGDREIARDLGIGFATVRTYLQRAFLKLGVSNRTELAARIGRPRT